MQSGDEVAEKELAIFVWDMAAGDAIARAEELQRLGVHKSICNRLLEPFAHMVTIVTATEYDNFFHLRADRQAMPEFRILATKMLELYVDGTPEEKVSGEWHMPFGDQMSTDTVEHEALAIASARCARLSYLTHEGQHSIEADLDLFNRLVSSGHWSPLEHCATPMPHSIDFKAPQSNFVGWLQYRKLFYKENMVLGDEGRRRRLQEIHG